MQTLGRFCLSCCGSESVLESFVRINSDNSDSERLWDSCVRMSKYGQLPLTTHEEGIAIQQLIKK
jgi:hypothetical protein